MLDFIVLGIVPGTSLQITFGWILFSMVLAAIAFLVIFESNRIRTWIVARQLSAYFNKIAL